MHAPTNVSAALTLRPPVELFVKLMVNPSRIVFKIGNQSQSYSLLSHQLSHSYLRSSPLIDCTSKDWKRG